MAEKDQEKRDVVSSEVPHEDEETDSDGSSEEESEDESIATSDKLEKEEERESDDAFSDAQESTGSPFSRDLTRSSHSTVASVPEFTTTIDLDSPLANKLAHEPSKLGLSTHQDSTSELAETGSISAVKSPLSQRRISTSSLDEVSLMDDLPPAKEAPSSPPEPVSTSILTRFSRSSTTASQAPSASSVAPTAVSRKNSQSGPPPPVPEKTPVPPPVRRSPFSWLRSTPKEAPVPPPKEAPGSRRHTNSSVLSNSSTVNSNATSSTALNSELLLARIEANKETLTKADAREKDELLKGTESLRESFKRIREREAQGEPLGNNAKGQQSAISALVSGAGLAILPGQSAQSPPPTARSSGILEVDENPTAIADSDPHTPGPAVNGEDYIDWDLWQSVIEDPYKVASTMPNELNRAIQAGIPHTIRGTVWQCMAQSKSLELEEMYRDVLALGPQATAIDARPLFRSYWPTGHSAESPGDSSRIGSPKLGSPKSKAPGGLLSSESAKKTVAQLEKVIKKDLGDRTSFGKYKVDQKALLNICKVYALFDPDVGYTQGMTFVATPLLLNMPEEEAFCLFVKLMCRYDLRSMFQERMKGLELRLYQYDRLLEDLDPRLSVHLKRQNIQSSLYAAQWFLTLFTYKFPLQLVLRVFDLLFSEGLEGAVLKFGVVLMRKNADVLLGMDFEALGPFLKEKLFDVYLDASPSANSIKEAGFFGNGGEKEVYRANMMVQDACAVTVTQGMLNKYESEWTESERIKRDHELEVEGLRNSNNQLSNKVKKLEDELELLNKEHVDLLNGMVVKNVENRHLQDENEQLATLVEELKKTVEAQPMEVEARYKAELERLMERQLDVHNENQALEEQTLVMEKDLVKTKMELAEVSQAYEILKNRWSELKKALGD